MMYNNQDKVQEVGVKTCLACYRRPAELADGPIEAHLELTI